MIKQLEWEASMRREETEILAQKLAERVKAVERANQQVTDTNNYLEVVMRQNVARVKELTEELDLTKRNLDNTKKNGGKESNLYTKVERVNMSPNFGQRPFNLAALGANGVNREVSLVSRQESVHNSRHREVYIPPHRRLNKPDKGWWRKGTNKLKLKPLWIQTDRERPNTEETESEATQFKVTKDEGAKVNGNNKEDKSEGNREQINVTLEQTGKPSILSILSEQIKKSLEEIEQSKFRLQRILNRRIPTSEVKYTTTKDEEKKR